jgi:hypothetical protein
MSAPVDERELAQQPQLRAAADHDHVEQAVVGHRVRGDAHASPEVGAVGHDGEVEGALVDRGAIHGDPHRHRSPARDGAERSEQEGAAPSQGLGRPVHQLGDQSGEGDARDVHEVGPARLAVRPAKVDAARVHPARLAPRDALHGRVEIAREKPEPAREVAPGAEGQEGHLGVARQIGAEQPGRDLARRPVPAGHDHELGAGAHALARDALGVPVSARELDLDRTERVAQPRLDGGPTAARGAAATLRIHDREDPSRHAIQGTPSPGQRAAPQAACCEALPARRTAATIW